jgi:CarboxypepD_reg-like domain
MKKLFILFLVFSFTKIYSQQYFVLSGTVVDTLQQPLSAASVFCQNTTIGTSASTSGEFKLYLPEGGYNLIVTYTGYQTQSIQISNSTPSPITIVLKPKEKELAEVIVQSSNEVKDGWEKYGKFFLENFIGSSPNAEKCSLQNPGALKFLFIKKKNKLKSIFTGSNPLLTRETSRTAQAKVYYNNSKILKALPGFTFRKMEDTVKDTCAVYLTKTKE